MDAYSTKAVAFDQLRCTRGKTRAIRLPNSGATFTGCRFIDNGMTITNVANGLGVCIEKKSTTASFTDCTFLGNRATNNFATSGQFYGGAVYLGDWTVGNFDNCLFVSNGLDFAVSSSNTKCAGGNKGVARELNVKELPVLCEPRGGDRDERRRNCQCGR